MVVLLILILHWCIDGDYYKLNSKEPSNQFTCACLLPQIGLCDRHALESMDGDWNQEPTAVKPSIFVAVATQKSGRSSVPKLRVIALIWGVKTAESWRCCCSVATGIITDVSIDTAKSRLPECEARDG